MDNKKCQYCKEPIGKEGSISITIRYEKEPPVFHIRCFDKATKQIIGNLNNKK